jgi:hypothetical protein
VFQEKPDTKHLVFAAVSLLAIISFAAYLPPGRPTRLSMTASAAPATVLPVDAAVATESPALASVSAAAELPVLGGAPAKAPSPSTPDLASNRDAYLEAMYVSVVPARQRAALAGRYVLGYNLPGIDCGTGCTGLFGGQARSSFNVTFFAEPLAYQRNTVAHEAAHAYGFLFVGAYWVPSWAGLDGWQAKFFALDRNFVGTYAAEAWAACVAWQETGFNDPIDQIKGVCTREAAAVAMSVIG